MGEPIKKPRPRLLDPNYGRFKKSQKHEKRLAKRLGGRALPRSGGMPWSKWDPTSAGGDIQIPELLIEHKRTELGSISIKLEWLTKVIEGARRVAKTPSVIVTFEKHGKIEQEWAMIPLSVLEQILQNLRTEA